MHKDRAAIPGSMSRRKFLLLPFAFFACGTLIGKMSRAEEFPLDVSVRKEMQLTDRPGGHVLTNINVWSPDVRWIVYDTRSDPAGERFDGRTIEIVNVETREVREVYQSRNGAHCGVASFSPASDQVAFILGPENPTDDWTYAAWHRQGVIVDIERPGVARAIDARDVLPPFTPGALRGGTHVHVFSGDGEWISFTYEDHVLATLDAAGGRSQEFNQRNVGVSVPARPVIAAKGHPRNHDGEMFSVLVSRTVNEPRPGSENISKASEDAWVGTNGYLRPDGTRQHRAIAFQGHVRTKSGATISEVFVADMPDDLTVPGDAPLEGTTTTRPGPPRGVVQRRLTHTEGRKYPGLQGPRHWLRSSPDGARIAFLMRDEDGIVQIWTISPNCGEPKQLTRNKFDVASAFSWSPDGRSIAYIADNSVFISDAATGIATRLTSSANDALAPRPEACVFSPDGKRIAYVRPIEKDGRTFNQIFVVHH
jgi:Tol biopolymer transport system component